MPNLQITESSLPNNWLSISHNVLFYIRRTPPHLQISNMIYHQYCSKVWRASPTMYLIDNPELTKSLPPLSLRREVLDSFIVIISQVIVPNKLVMSGPSIAIIGHPTRLSVTSHFFTAEIRSKGTNHVQQSFFARTSFHQNFLPNKLQSCLINTILTSLISELIPCFL